MKLFELKNGIRMSFTLLAAFVFMLNSSGQAKIMLQKRYVFIQKPHFSWNNCPTCSTLVDTTKSII